jgi:tRNA pseudouridine32 synthase/23S rRNA pseudouridine746 synthase
MQNPFDEQPPHPLAQGAARALMAQLPVPTEGKMFGVLVAEGGAVLKAFSAGVDAEGWAPHVFDAAARARIEPPSDVLVKALTARLAEAEAPLREREALAQQLGREREALQRTHAARRTARRTQREQLGASTALDELSRADGRERRTFEANAKAALARFAAAQRHHAAIERLRRIVSREAMKRIHDTYVFRNARNEQTTLRALFHPHEPPWGAGECAAVKLLAHALALKLKPVAVAEFWWGPPPSGGARVHGTFYPACRPKCGPVLPFLLRGLPVAPLYRFSSAPAGTLEVLYEDERCLVVSKPVGLLSVPGKTQRDCVLERLRERHPAATLVHRLDLDTSGVLLAALDADAHRALQHQFRDRTIGKRYVAWLERELDADGGTLDLPLRVDLEQRPRQCVCFEHGKTAITHWQVLERAHGRTRVAFFPETGRTHQLRVHASHPRGLNAAIVGDNLYGRGGPRLMLHAETLSFNHPATGRRLTLTAPVPF